MLTQLRMQNGTLAHTDRILKGVKVAEQLPAPAAIAWMSAMSGPFRQLGTFPLRPGTHNVDLRSPDGQNLFQQKVDMLAD